MSPAGKMKVNNAAALWVSKRGSCHGRKKPKSGAMLPITSADSTLQRPKKRANGRTAAAWDMVNGMVRSGIHQSVILPVYKKAVASQHSLNRTRYESNRRQYDRGPAGRDHFAAAQQ